MSYSYFQFNMTDFVWQASNKLEFQNGKDDKIMISLACSEQSNLSNVDMIINQKDWQKFVRTVKDMDKDVRHYYRLNRKNFSLFSDEGNAAVKQYIDDHPTLRPNEGDVRSIREALSDDYPEVNDTACREAIYDYLEARVNPI